MIRRPQARRALCVAALAAACGHVVSAQTPDAVDTHTSAASTPVREVAVPRLDGLPALLGLPPVLDLPTARSAGRTTDDQASPLGLLEAASRARRISPDVRAAGFRAEAAMHTREAAEAAMLPRADIRYGAGAGVLTSIEPHSRMRRQEGLFTVRQTLFDELNRQEGRRQGLVSDSLRLQHDAAGSQATLDAAAAWLQVAQSAIALRLGGEYERRLTELLRYISERAAAGGASGAERDRVSGRAANIRGALAETRAALTAASRQLERLIGEPVTSVSMAGARHPAVPADAERAFEEALRSNPDLRALKSEREAAAVDQRVQRARFLPRLELELTHTRNRNASGVAGDVTDTKAMLVLNVPLLNGGGDLAQVRGAAARLSEMDARMDGVTLRLRQELQGSYANLEAAQTKYASVREEMANNQRVVDAFQAQLTAGNRPLLDVLDAYQRLHQSRLDMAQVLIAVAQNEWRIGHLLGQLPALPDVPVEGN